MGSLCKVSLPDFYVNVCGLCLALCMCWFAPVTSLELGFSLQEQPKSCSDLTLLNSKSLPEGASGQSSTCLILKFSFLRAWYFPQETTGMLKSFMPSSLFELSEAAASTKLHISTWKTPGEEEMALFWFIVALKMSRFPAQHRKQDHGSVVLRNFPVIFMFHFFYQVVALNKRKWESQKTFLLNWISSPSGNFSFPLCWGMCPKSQTGKPLLSQKTWIWVHQPPSIPFPKETNLLQLLHLSGRFPQIIWNLAVNLPEGPEPPLDQGFKTVGNWWLRKKGSPQWRKVYSAAQAGECAMG